MKNDYTETVIRVSKQSAGITRQILNLCDEIQYKSNISLIQSFAEHTLRSRRRSTIIEIDFAGDEVTAALMYLLSHARKANASAPVEAPLRVLVIADEHLPLAQAFISGLNPVREGVHLPVLLGSAGDVRADLKLLRGRTPVIIGTPSRIIDHVRRANLTLAKVRQFGVVEPTQVHDSGYIESFDQDLLYINEKVPNKAGKLLFAGRSARLAEFRGTMPRASVLTSAQLRADSLVVLYRAGSLSPQAISDYIYAQGISEVQVITSYPKVHRELESYFAQNQTLYSVTLKHLSESATIPSAAGHILYAGLPMEERRINQMSSINPVIAGTHHIIYTAQDAASVIPIQENYSMSTRFETPETAEVMAGKIKLLIETIEKDSNPEELNSLKRLIKKSVPFYRRGYLTAYLLREYLAGAGKPARTKSRARKTEAPAQNFSEEESATLFFGIGRSRRAYPKDLTKLITTETGLEADVVLAIKALDNYSFVTVKKESAELIIEKLNGQQFKGKELVVNPARSKK